MSKVNWCTVISAFLFSLVSNVFAQSKLRDSTLQLNGEGYYEAPGINIMMFDDFYPEGHQGGFTIIQSGTRIAANGDIRLEPTPGQWSPVPKVGEKHIDREKGIISVNLWYPDSSRNQKGFNPIHYSGLIIKYTVRTESVGGSIRLIVDLEKPLPREWANKVGFNLELFPGNYFGEHYFMDGKTGIFPRQANGPMKKDEDGNFQITPLAVGEKLIIAPTNIGKELKIVSSTNDLQLIDGRGLHNNGWFVVRSIIPTGAVKNAVEWIITPKANPGWKYKPVIQVSQIGYHPKQVKFAVIELDKLTENFEPVQLLKIREDSITIVKADATPKPWGRFLRYQYVRFDFSSVTEEGLYKIRYGNIESNEFEIKKDIFARHVWQPTLEYFLPVQMCHMKIKDRYKTWHGVCHMDDAVMAPINHNHFDGYYQQESTLTKFKSGEHVPGLNVGGWHDAGDYDLRIESQAETIYKLALAYEFFRNDYDETSINQETRVAEIHQPDGKPDILQQIEHGVLSIVSSYESMGRLYRGIQEVSLQQYVHLGDASTITDNLVYKENEKDQILVQPLPKDDRLVFTEKNPQRELYVAQMLAAASRMLRTYNPELAEKCLTISEELYKSNSSAKPMLRINAAAELYLTTSKNEYELLLQNNVDSLSDNIERFSEVVGRITAKINDRKFTEKIEIGVKRAFKKIAELQKENPYGVPYKPYIWGAGWGIQSFGVKQLFLHLGFPKIFTSEYVFNAMNFILGCHPGENTASFASGVGVKSLTVAYGVNRDEWSYIPGGVGSGTALIRPDLPELKIWPYFWQQTEYVMGGGATDFMLLTMAADYLLNK
jgi:Glycosyl hydrolase family 9./N-terminal ig-like domain of cellulase.